MKQLFTIACTLVLGSALGFAQAATPTPSASGDQAKTGTSTTTKKHHHTKKSSKKSTKKSKKGAAATATPEASPTPK
jgi:hypothetical protein